MVSIDFSLT